MKGRLVERALSCNDIQRDAKKGHQWNTFELEVLCHIHTYTNPQYGDSDDNQQWQGMDLDFIRESLQRYVKRIGKNIRGDEESLRDALKIAHYACRLYVELTELIREKESKNE